MQPARFSGLRFNEPKKCVAIGAPAVEALIDGLWYSRTDTSKECMLALFPDWRSAHNPALIASLRKPFKQVGGEEKHEAAANCLVGFGSKAVEPLIDTLKDNDSGLRAIMPLGCWAALETPVQLVP